MVMHWLNTVQNYDFFSHMTKGHRNDVNFYNFSHHFRYLEDVTISLELWDPNEIQNKPELFSNQGSLSKLAIIVKGEYRVNVN